MRCGDGSWSPDPCYPWRLSGRPHSPCANQLLDSSSGPAIDGLASLAQQGANKTPGNCAALIEPAKLVGGQGRTMGCCMARSITRMTQH